MIKLTDKLSITADNNQYTLGTPVETKQKDKQGDLIIMMKNASYYTTLAGAIKAAVSKALKHGVAKDEITTLQDFLQEERKLQSEFENLLKPLEV